MNGLKPLFSSRKIQKRTANCSAGGKAARPAVHLPGSPPRKFIFRFFSSVFFDFLFLELIIPDLMQEWLSRSVLSAFRFLLEFWRSIFFPASRKNVLILVWKISPKLVGIVFLEFRVGQIILKLVQGNQRRKGKPSCGGRRRHRDWLS